MILKQAMKNVFNSSINNSFYLRACGSIIAKVFRWSWVTHLADMPAYMADTLNNEIYETFLGQFLFDRRKKQVSEGFLVNIIHTEGNRVLFVVS